MSRGCFALFEWLDAFSDLSRMLPNLLRRSSEPCSLGCKICSDDSWRSQASPSASNVRGLVEGCLSR